MASQLPTLRRLGTRLAVVAVSVVSACSGGGDPTGPTPPPPPPPPPNLSNDPPTPAREFRGLWVATVANIDWPTQPGLTQSAALDEMRVILDRAQALRMNAVILQVRAAGDALYPSPKEPWSRVLTGTQGVAPGWNPLATWIDEAHRRGLELHAWFNPFRAGNVSDTSRLAPNHLARARPDLARIAQGQLWFDPGEPEVRQWTLDVILHVAGNYDIDAVHLDDYFYPYPLTGAARPVQFPDDSSYQKYRAAGGVDMPRDAWRRQNIDSFVQRLYGEIRALKPTLRVGISPFGIWRPGSPPGITGLDAYADIFADSKRWLENGWLDYFAPQLYWPLSSTGQNFSALFDWWLSVNTERRHVWPGLAAYRVADGTSSAYFASEIVAEIAHIRTRAGPTSGGGSGALLYNTTSVRLNRGGLAEALGTGSFASLALVPAFPWLDDLPPATPSLMVSSTGSAIRAIWNLGDEEPVRWWLLQWRNALKWDARLIWGGTYLYDIPFTSPSDRADVVALTALDGSMNASTRAIWRATP